MDFLPSPPSHPPTNTNNAHLGSWHFSWRPSPSPSPPPTGLLDNCDLPPPLKVFFSPKQVAFFHGGGDDGREEAYRLERSSSVHRALRLSQTRAREAERKAAMESERSEQVSRLLLEESAKLSAHRHWVRLLEIEISMLEKEKRRRLEKAEEKGDYMVPPLPPETWWLAFALCLGIAGVGFVLGRCTF